MRIQDLFSPNKEASQIYFPPHRQGEPLQWIFWQTESTVGQKTQDYLRTLGGLGYTVVKDKDWKLWLGRLRHWVTLVENLPWRAHAYVWKALLDPVPCTLPRDHPLRDLQAPGQGFYLPELLPLPSFWQGGHVQSLDEKNLRNFTIPVSIPTPGIPRLNFFTPNH
jgi:hypothetical protein